MDNQADLAPQQPTASTDAVIAQQAPSVARPTMNGQNAGTSSTAGNVSKIHGPCIVCGALKEDSEDMPAKSLYCPEHKRAVDSLTRACEATDKKNENMEFMRALKAVRGGCKSGPPSKFSLSELIMEYQAYNPSESHRRKA